jgi:hypothetical protein
MPKRRSERAQRRIRERTARSAPALIILYRDISYALLRSTQALHLEAVCVSGVGPVGLSGWRSKPTDRVCRTTTCQASARMNNALRQRS